MNGWVSDTLAEVREANRAANAIIAQQADELAALTRKLEETEASLPWHTNREQNTARDALGRVWRLKIGENGGYPEVGVVEVNQAREALVSAYADVNALRDEVARLKVENTQLTEAIQQSNRSLSASIGETRESMRLAAAIRWALGETDEFPLRQPGQGAFWWRTELRRRSGLIYTPPTDTQ